MSYPANKISLSLLDNLERFNLSNQTNLNIDTLRFEYNKQYKHSKVKSLGEWLKLTDKHLLYQKLIKRLTAKELTSVYRLINEAIYYFNCSNPPKYRKAIMIIFGITQPNKEPNHDLINKITSLLPITSLDICSDSPFEPNIDNLSRAFILTKYDDNTYYINDTGYPLLDKITIYNKQVKNRLSSPLWRMEATISIVTTNPDYLSLPLNEFKSIIGLAYNQQT
jgi:hypothetical protein